MGSKVNLFELRVLNILRGIDVTGIVPEVALYTAAPTESSAGTEVSGVNYARASVTFSSPAGPDPMSTQNVGAVSFPTPGVGGWGTVVGFGVVDSDSNLYYFGAQTPNKVINEGDTVQYDDGTIVITED
jgi:hypothetical protein